MAAQRRQRNRQGELFARSTKSVIAIDENHCLVQLTHEIDWTELKEVVQAIRMSKLKSEAGRPPRLRAPRTSYDGGPAARCPRAVGKRAVRAVRI